MTSLPRKPFGTWPSPIAAAHVPRARIRLGHALAAGGHVWWQEVTPEDAGRTKVVMRTAGGRTRQVLAAPWSARTRVHEYGGRSYLPVQADGPDWRIVFANESDQRLYLTAPIAP